MSIRFPVLCGLALILGASVCAQQPDKLRPNRRAEKETAKPNKEKSGSWKERRFGKIKIRVRQDRPGSSDIRGTLPAESKVPEMAERVFEALEIFPPAFLEKSRIRYVTFLDDLTLRKVPAGGVASGDTIYLKTTADSRTVYHELFHTFDPSLQINQNRKWMSFNDRNFVYTGSGFISMKTTKFRRKKRQDNLESGRFDRDFVSRYAMSNDVEDRAETFAFMMAEGPAFLKRAEASPVLKKKMEYIIDLTGKKRLLGKDFWDRHFHPEKKAREPAPAL